MFQINTSSNPSGEAANKNFEILKRQLSLNNSVTWLLAGGSAIKVYEEMDELLSLDIDFSKLKISLGDERYSKDASHKDATWPVYQKLELFKVLKKRGAKIFEILSGESLQKDADRFNEFLHEGLSNSDFVLCNLGVGIDCHTAGIIPMEDKNLFEIVYPENRLAVGHEYGGAHPKRITVTPAFLKKTNKIIVYMTGADKKLVLQDLNEYKELEKTQNMIYKHPALVASLMSAEVFTDQKLS